MAGISRNAAILEGLRRSRAENRLHHAYILSGPEGGAKLDCVEKFAAEVFAEGKAEGLFGAAGGSDPAQSLRRIQQRNHPDFTVLQPVNETLGVNEVRELPRLLAFSPLESPQRIVLILGAACMNTQAANALLKILEEPPGHTMFFLLCRDPSELLPTIISRCQVLRFAPMGEAELVAAIGENTDPQSVVAFSEGSLERARALLAQEEGIELRRAAGENLLALWEASPRVPSAVAHWAESLTDEESCRVAIDSWAQLVRDLLFTLSGAKAEDLLFRELHPRLSALVAGEGHKDKLWEETAAKSSAINRFRVYREFNGNLRLDLASLLVDLQLISVGKRV